MNGKNCKKSLAVHTNESVSSLRKRIAKALNPDPDSRLRLFANGKELKDSVLSVGHASLYPVALLLSLFSSEMSGSPHIENIGLKNKSVSWG